MLLEIDFCTLRSVNPSQGLSNWVTIFAFGDKFWLTFRPVDPSLFLHRFAARMGFGQKMHQVANTALRLVQSMKRDWLQTGRRPAGICGAALYIAGHIHGIDLNLKSLLAFSFNNFKLSLFFDCTCVLFYSLIVDFMKLAFSSNDISSALQAWTSVSQASQ